jgi:polysaccharide biosynthesis protein VpsM
MLILKKAVIEFSVYLITLLGATLCFGADGQETRNLTEKLEMATFGSFDEAADYLQKLRESGYHAQIEAGTADKDQTAFQVYVLISKNAYYPLDYSVLPEKMEPAGKTGRPWSLLGIRRANLHGSLALSGIYTDDVLNSKDHKQSDFSTVLSPSIWIAVPAIKKNVAPFRLSLRSPGGFLLTRDWPDVLYNHYQTYLFYRADIPLTSSSGTYRYGRSPAHTASGNLLLRGNRFTLFLEDHYESSHEEREAGVVLSPGQQGRYNSNSFGVALLYETRNRLLLSGGYSHFFTKYSSRLNDFRNREDDGLFASLTYRLSPRISFMTEYRFFDITYDKAGALDSSEHYILGGVSWDFTAKTKGTLKAGYAVKDFSNSPEIYEHFSVEGQLDYRFTPKTLIAANVYRKTSETNLSGMAFSVTDGLDLRLQHLLNPKITTTAGFVFLHDQYKNLQLADTVTADTYQWSLAVQYAFRTWLKGNLGYAFTRKNSSLRELEYDRNTLFFTIMSSI